MKIDCAGQARFEGRDDYVDIKIPLSIRLSENEQLNIVGCRVNKLNIPTRSHIPHLTEMDIQLHTNKLSKAKKINLPQNNYVEKLWFHITVEDPHFAAQAEGRCNLRFSILLEGEKEIEHELIIEIPKGETIKANVITIKKKKFPNVLFAINLLIFIFTILVLIKWNSDNEDIYQQTSVITKSNVAYFIGFLSAFVGITSTQYILSLFSNIRRIANFISYPELYLDYNTLLTFRKPLFGFSAFVLSVLLLLASLYFSHVPLPKIDNSHGFYEKKDGILVPIRNKRVYVSDIDDICIAIIPVSGSPGMCIAHMQFANTFGSLFPLGHIEPKYYSFKVVHNITGEEKLFTFKESNFSPYLKKKVQFIVNWMKNSIQPDSPAISYNEKSKVFTVKRIDYLSKIDLILNEIEDQWVTDRINKNILVTPVIGGISHYIEQLKLPLKKEFNAFSGIELSFDDQRKLFMGVYRKVYAKVSSNGSEGACIELSKTEEGQTKLKSYLTQLWAALSVFYSEHNANTFLNKDDFREIGVDFQVCLKSDNEFPITEYMRPLIESYIIVLDAINYLYCDGESEPFDIYIEKVIDGKGAEYYASYFLIKITFNASKEPIYRSHWLSFFREKASTLGKSKKFVCLMQQIMGSDVISSGLKIELKKTFEPVDTFMAAFSCN